MQFVSACTGSECRPQRYYSWVACTLMQPQQYCTSLCELQERDPDAVMLNSRCACLGSSKGPWTYKEEGASSVDASAAALLWREAAALSSRPVIALPHMAALQQCSYTSGPSTERKPVPQCYAGSLPCRCRHGRQAKGAHAGVAERSMVDTWHRSTMKVL